MTDRADRRSSQSEALLAAIVDSTDDAIISKDLTGIVTSWNRAAERIFGFTAEEMIGQSIRRLIPPAYHAEEDMILDRIAQGHKVATFQTRRQTSDGRLIPVSITVSPVRDALGTVVGASKIARDLSDNGPLAQQLRDSDLRFRVMADNIPQLAWMADPQGYLYWYNQRWFDYTGTTLGDVKGWGWTRFHHPDHVDRVVARIQESWRTGTQWEDSFPMRGADGHYRWFLAQAMPIHDARGDIVCWFGTQTDITNERAQQEQIRLLMREVNHRAKNMLAMIQSLARRTAPGGDSAFVDRFEKRIQAMAANQDLLMTRQWRGADLADLIRAQLYLFDDLIGQRVHLDGAPLMIKPGQAETIGLAIHELATNAAKYGALSVDGGNVHIRWSLDETSDPPAFHFVWQESGGPPVTPPEREGFGSTVIKRMPRMSLNAQVDLDFAESGVVWRLSCDAARVLESWPGAKPPEVAPLTTKEVGTGPILIVEDEELIALDLINALGDAGYWCIGPATSVATGLALIARQRPLAVLLDARLGDDSSAPVAAELRVRKIPFLLISGFSEAELAADFGETPLLRKPVQIPMLLRALEPFIATKSGKAD